MKKILLTMVAILSLTAVQAQESDNKQQPQFRGPRQITPEQMADRMANDLKLTDEQPHGRAAEVGRQAEVEGARSEQGV